MLLLKENRKGIIIILLVLTTILIISGIYLFISSTERKSPPEEKPLNEKKEISNNEEWLCIFTDHTPYNEMVDKSVFNYRFMNDKGEFKNKKIEIYYYFENLERLNEYRVNNPDLKESMINESKLYVKKYYESGINEINLNGENILVPNNIDEALPILKETGYECIKR